MIRRHPAITATVATPAAVTVGILAVGPATFGRAYVGTIGNAIATAAGWM